jgi:dienelactone hydrolase
MNADELARYYDYPRGPIHATVNTKSEKGLWTRAIVEFEMELPPDLHGKEVDEARRQVAATKDPNRAKLMSLEYTVRFDYFRPKSEGKHPLIMMSPILGGNSLFVEEIAGYFAANGYCVALVHRKRSVLRNNEGLEQIERNLRKSVMRVRQALDWALQQPEVDPDKVASFGISYGAIVNTMVAGAEPRIKYHVFALGGGNLPGIIMSSAEPQIRRQVAKMARLNGWTSEQLRAELERTLKSDPLNSAPLLDRDNVLMVVAQYDSVVGTPYENLLWRKIGKPQRIVVPLGHYTTALALPFIKGQALRFLDKKCGIPPREVPGSNFQAHSSKRY